MSNLVGDATTDATAQRNWYEPLIERGLVPDSLLRAGIRRRLSERLAREGGAGEAASGDALEGAQERMRAFIRELDASPVAVHTDAANRQHYELPPAFFELCLGPRLKYSSCVWPAEVRDLAGAEEAMLALTCERAQLADGQQILELGCGWGSLTLWMAERYPGSSITAVSNSALQREHILTRARTRGLGNIRVITADMRDFAIGETFDRVVSVEMFEHMKNYRELLRRVSLMMRDGALLFVHIFTHVRHAYHFDAADDWIGKYFFTGGTMPSDSLLLYFQDDVQVVDHWRLDGRHYERTANAWLARLDANRERALAVLKEAYGDAEAHAWLQRWRVFFMACAELWGFEGGSEWIVSHYLFRRRS